MYLRECGAGRELVAMVPALRHPNRVNTAERSHEKLLRSFQRMRLDDRKWATAMADPYFLPALLARLARRCARRSRVMYGRMAAKGGAR